MYLPREIEEIKEQGWVVHGRSEHTVYCHISEIPENGADIGHFNPVHQVNALYGSDLQQINKSKQMLSNHIWSNASWKADEEDWYLATGTLEHEIKIAGYRVPFLQTNHSFEQIGPGVVYLKSFESANAPVVLYVLVVPVAPFTTKLFHVVVSRKTLIGKLQALTVISIENIMVERDIVIWNNKKFTNRSVFSSSYSDELIKKFRRWYSQFYSENSGAKSRELNADFSW
ncbi:hypothetical protein EB796_005657 [Bugula neritina]|uniref:3-ketosteroid-9-alpha-monooxygenase oxygenase component-like C-terminal domain-containing protein n=1 Tax=Bugula neritina TaxID=10212 RepID=A0A7J7KBL6_BUGNE|nr:hypothetical protein EB796_005657 [Bugula neritina]